MIVEWLNCIFFSASQEDYSYKERVFNYEKYSIFDSKDIFIVMSWNSISLIGISDFVK